MKSSNNLKRLSSSGFTLIRTSLRENLAFRKLKVRTSLRENLVSIQQGFTLIELLVVMMIIGLLAAISIFAMQGARGQGRDARRKADLESIRSGIELYKSDCNRYPIGSGNVTSVLGTTLTGSTCALPGNVYIQQVPNDPTTGRNYYYSSAAGATYELCASLEEPPVPPSACGGSCGVACNFRTRNP